MRNFSRFFFLSTISVCFALTFSACGKDSPKKQKVENCSELDGKEQDCKNATDKDGKNCSYVAGNCVADSAPSS